MVTINIDTKQENSTAHLLINGREETPQFNLQAERDHLAKMVCDGVGGEVSGFIRLGNLAYFRKDEVISITYDFDVKEKLHYLFVHLNTKDDPVKEIRYCFGFLNNLNNGSKS